MKLLNLDNSPGPKMHVFLIGVGGYSFVKGGINAKQQQFDYAKDTGQLKSPEASVRELYKTLVDLQARGLWTTPIGSIEVLLSPAPGGSNTLNGETLKPATIANIMKSYNEWKDRCDSDGDNVAFFFYCGHGFEHTSQYLLAEDFADNIRLPFLGAFNFNETRVAFESCNAKTQLFFVDSCRNITNDMLINGTPCMPLDTPSNLTTNCLYDLTQRAAAKNQSAQGKANEASYYTKALIKGLEGGAAKKKGSNWVVTTGNLCRDIIVLIESVKSGQGFKERCHTVYNGSMDLINYSSPPMVDMTVCCTPDNAHLAASFSCNNLETNKVISNPPQPLPWNFMTEAGMYKITAQFENGEFNDEECYEFITPPSSERKIEF